MIRRAAIADVPAFGKIINDCAEYGLMLHRSLEFLYEHLRDFSVAVDDETGEVVGVCGLRILWANLAEVYALAVAPQCRGQGLGKKLVEATVEDSTALGIRKLMTLTYEQAFFTKVGFAVVDRMTLPMKVWSECARCSKRNACDEIAMIRVLDVPEIAIPKAAAPLGVFETPVVLKPGMSKPVGQPMTMSENATHRT